MSGIVDLEVLLQTLQPTLMDVEYVFCTVHGELADYLHLNPIATFSEPEGLTLVLPQSVAQNAGLKFESSFRQILLKVHSSLDAVGLTAAVSSALAKDGISANVIAAYYHDHIF
ncbi:MAG: ACT domain-containing protein, partial [Pseudomonadales bacterium]|nr:ACT domain-containing protein [Pseudomonadales bacterium]